MQAADFTSLAFRFGNWEDPAQWDTPGAPDTFPNNGAMTYDAVVSDAILILNQNITIQKLQLDSPYSTTALFSGSFNLTANELLTWKGGAMGGSGATNANGGMSIEHGALVERTLNNAIGQTATIQGEAFLEFVDNATFNNYGHFLVPTGTSLQISADGVFNNFGTLTSDTGSGSLSILSGFSTETDLATFNNSGIVNVLSGAMLLPGGTSVGGFQISAGAMLKFREGVHNLNAGTSITGAGSVAFEQGDLPVNFNAGIYNVATTSVLNGTVNFNAAATTQTLNLGGETFFGGTIGGSGTLTVTGPVNWAGGAMTGSGVTNANGGLIIGEQAYGVLLSGRTLNLAAGQTAILNSSLGVSDSAIINNRGTFFARSENFFGLDGNAGMFNNIGVFTRDIATGQFRVEIPFNNSGVVNVQTGTLTFSGGGPAATGDFNVSSGATLRFDSAFNTTSTSEISGAGNVRFSFGTVNLTGAYTITGDTVIDGGTANFNGPNLALATASIVDGTLGGTAAVTASGLLTWAGGQMRGTGVTNANGGINFSGDYSVILAQRTLNLGSGQTATFGASGDIDLFMETGAVFNNAGTFIAQNDRGIHSSGGSGGVFNNTGVFTRNGGTDVFSIDAGVIFRNSGLVNVLTGTLALSGGGGTATTGSFLVSPGATLRFNSSFNLAPVASVAGGGNVEFSAGTLNVFGAYNVGGTSTFSGANVTIKSSSPNPASGPMTISAGSASFTFSSLTVPTLNLLGGTLGGPANIAVTGRLVWEDGMMRGTGVTQANGGIDFRGNGDLYLAIRRLNNASGQTATFGASGIVDLYFEDGATFSNAGLFLAQNNRGLRYNGGTGNVFNNTGMFTRNTESGTFSVDSGVTFRNSGIVNVETGTLALRGGDGGETTGDFVVLPGASIEFAGGFTFKPESSITGGGTIILSGGISEMRGGNLTGAKVNVTGGELEIAASQTLAELSIGSGALVTLQIGQDAVPDFRSEAIPEPAIAGLIATGILALLRGGRRTKGVSLTCR